MTRSDLLNRVITAAALVALAVTLGVWLTRSPLTAAPAAIPPAATPVPPSVKAAEALPESTLAPLPPPTATTTEVQLEVEIAPAAPIAADPPAVKATEKPANGKAEPQSNYQPRRRGLFRRRS
jgi:hypothetical protein